MTSIYQRMVRDFHFGIGQHTADIPLRIKLIKEEADEFADAIHDSDTVEAIDALCDLLYVTYGTADLIGVELLTLAAEATPVEKPQSFYTLQQELGVFSNCVGDVILVLNNFENRLFRDDPKSRSVALLLTELANGSWICGARGLGVDLRPFFNEVHRTNMHKLSGPKREDGKQLKPADWKPPRIKAMYDRLRKNLTPYCVHRTEPEFAAHPDGGYFCTSCGGLFTRFDEDNYLKERSK